MVWLIGSLRLEVTSWLVENWPGCGTIVVNIMNN